MKRLLLFSITFLLAGGLFVQDSRAEDYTRWNLPEGALARFGKGEVGVAGGGRDHAVVYSPDGTRLAVASSIGIWLYDATTGAEVALLTGHTDGVTSVAFSPNGKTLASGGSLGEGAIRLWDVATGQERAILEGYWGIVEIMAFSPDGKTLASASINAQEYTIRLWDVATGQEKAILEGHSGYVASMAFSPDGKTLASGSDWDGTIRLWDVTRSKEKTALPTQIEFLNWVSFSPDGATLAGAGFGVVRLWDVDSGQLKASLRHGGEVWQVSFSPDGTTLASGKAHTVSLWDVDSGQLKASLEGHTGWVLPVSYSPDGQTLASGSRDNTIRLWDVSTGQAKSTLKGHTDGVTSVSFSPDGQTLASGSDDGTILLWDMVPYITPSPRADWCSSIQTVVVSFQLQENGKTASICRDEANTLVYSFGILGGEPELEYRGPILGQISAGATLWGEGVRSLADLAAALVDESSTWFDPHIGADAIAKAAKSRETNGFYAIDTSTGLVSQSVYIFRRGGWEYAISSTWGQPVNVEENELEDYGSHEITVLSPKGKMYRLR